MIGESSSVDNSKSPNDARLQSFLTLAAVLLRAQSRQVVAQLVVNAAADFCPALTLSLLGQPGDFDTSVYTAQLDGVLLAPAELERWEAKFEYLLPNSNRKGSFFIDYADTDHPQNILGLQYFYYAQAQTPTQNYGWLIGGAREILDEEEQHYLRSLAQLTAIALENAARFEALKESAAETTLVNEVAGALATSLNAEELFHTFMTYLRNLLPIERAALAIISPDWSQYELAFSWNDQPGRVRRGYMRNLPLADSLLEQAVRQREIMVNPDTSLETSFFKVVDGARLIIPLLAKGQAVGALKIASRKAESFREDDPRLHLVEKLARLFALALVNSRLYEEKQLSAEFDSRVGVYNHDYFDRELAVQVEKARRLNYKLGLIMIDMDNLKTINDNYGHLAGDTALRHTASLISETVRATDVVARYGGDEFGVMLPGCTARSLEIVSEKARRNVCETPLELENGTKINLSISVGAALFPDDAETPLGLVQRADAAMYVAKQQKNEVRVGRKARLIKVSERELERGASEQRSQAETLVPEGEPLDMDGLDTGTWAANDYERFLNWLGGDRQSVVAKVLRETYRQLSETRQQLYDVQHRVNQVEDTMRHGLRAMSQAIELREPYLASSGEKIQRLAVQLAKESSCSPAQISEVEIAAWLVNAGRLSVPEYIWSKNGQLSAYDWRRVQQVPYEGARFAERWKPLTTPDLLLTLRHHRERYDGLGYPSGMAGEEIPLLARIIGLASAVVAMHQTRPFRPARSLSSIRSEIEQASGRQFDPHLARILLHLADKGLLDFLE